MESKLFAIIGDIHANLDALNVVLDDCRSQGVTDFLCTGDVVGYGACPHECLSIVRELGCPVVMGNHDQYVSHNNDLEDFNDAAADVIKWTRRQLSMDEMYWLRKLPYVAITQGISVVHSTMDHPEKFGYVFTMSDTGAHFPLQKTPICFHGHTHVPAVFEKQRDDQVSIIENRELVLPLGKKYFINVGSVGQPRDRDPRASYVLFNPKTREVKFRRLEYDIEAAQQRILKAGLPERLATRLAVGQ